jgi:hypothetical protein
VRQVIYAAVWIAGGLILGRRAGPRDFRPGPAAAWLVLYFAAGSFAAVDWIAALQPGWPSTIIGLYLIVSQILTAVAALCAVAAWRLRACPPGARDTLHDWGNLLLTAVVLHAYMAFSQFFIIWNGNLPNDISWYIPRRGGLWGVVSVLIITVHFGLPFVALLFRDVKDRPEPLLAVACVVLLARLFDTAWMVLPSAGVGIAGFALMILMVLAAGAAAWLWAGDRLRVSVPPAREAAA